MKKQLDKRSFRIIIAVVSILFVVAMLFMYVGYIRTIRIEKEKRQNLSQQYESISNENEQLKKYMAEDETSIYERSAKENGYVYPDEYVYVDGT